MTIEYMPDYFADRDQAISEIEGAGLKVYEAELSQKDFNPEPHTDGYGVRFYVLEGEMELHEPNAGRVHVLEPGSRTILPANTLHAESCAGKVKVLLGLPAEMNLG